MTKGVLVLALMLTAAARPASVEIRFGTAPVCAVVREALTGNAAMFQDGEGTARLERIEWRDPDDADSVPEGLGGAQESLFDFDNDGTPDRVFTRSFEDHYMQGSVLLVQSRQKKTDAWFIPCQLDAKTIALDECPPFSQKHDEAGFTMRGRTAAEKVFFRARYTDLTPFRFEGTTFVAVESHSADTGRYVGVVKPMAGKKIDPTCLLRVTARR